MTKTARILIIAGSDSGGGAGIQADIKTVTMLGGHAMTAITAITAQNTLGVTAVHPVPTEMVIAQMDAVISDIGVDAVKIGMIGSAETANAVADYLSAHRASPLRRQGPVDGSVPDSLTGPCLRRGDVPIVFDPVMIATSGDMLADADTIRAFDRLMAIATLTTPNLPELEALGGREALLARHIALFIKGGHAEGEIIVDRLDLAFNQSASWSDRRIETTSTHGTGCTLASAIATGLGQGLSTQQAVERARKFVRAALEAAPGLGQGHGPMGHQAVRCYKAVIIAGVDEAGRGPLAGPVVAAAVILCAGGIDGLDDSKKLSAKRRAVLEAEILASCVVGIGAASVEEIDRINILQATMLAMTRAVEALPQVPGHVMVDGNRLPQWRYSAEAVIGGDAIHPCISAASIIAKEHRDRIMVAADADYPGYGWASNKGYGAAVHMAALRDLGPTPLHRRSFAPVAQHFFRL